MTAGEEPSRPRAARFCALHAPRCIGGHRIDPGPFPSDRILTCGREAAGRAGCGRHLYLVKLWANRLTPLVLVAELTREELHHLASASLTLLARLDYLGLTVPGVSGDLPRVEE